jgi:nucleoside 2-deoxyribosyltransferase
VTYRLYLAGSSREPQRVREMAARIDATGIEITQRWWEPSDHGTPEEWGGKDGSIPRGVQAHLCRGHMRAIAEADVVFVLWPDNGVLSTCAVELGFALGKGKHLVVTGTRSNECTWTALEDTYRDPSDLLGLAEVARRAVEAGAIGLRTKGRWK